MWRTFTLERHKDTLVWSWLNSDAPDGCQKPIDEIPISSKERDSTKAFPYEEDPL